MIAVVDKRDVQNTEEFSHQMMDAFLLDREVEGVTPAIRRVLHAANATEIDFVMGVQVASRHSSHSQGWRRYVYACPSLLSAADYRIFVGNLTVKHGATWAVFGRRPLLMRARGMAREGMMDRAFGVMEEEAALPDGILLKGVPVALNAMPEKAMAMPAMPAMPEKAMAAAPAVPAVPAVPEAAEKAVVLEPVLMAKRRYMPGWNTRREPTINRQAWIPVVSHAEAEGEGEHAIGR